MPTFGFVGEGPTDHTVMRSILAAYWGDAVFIPSVQPIPGAPGGWPRVFTWLKDGRHQQALLEYDYLVIHLDSDESNRYDVPHVDGGVKLTPEALVSRIIERLKVAIGAEFHTKHAARFIFAIAVHEIECWILALHDDHHRHEGRFKKCLELANRELDRKRLPPLSKEGRGARISDPYRRASEGFADRTRLLAIRDRNPSLALFLHQLDAIAASPAP